MFLPRGFGRYETPNVAVFGGADPEFANVGLLALQDNGTDGSTTFTDQSSNAHTLTAVGNAQWDTAQAYTGLTSSLLGDGAGDRVDTPQSSTLRAVTNSTLEFFVRFNASAAAMRNVVFKHSGGKVVGIILGVSDKTKIELNHFGTGTLITSNASVIADATWYYIALTTESGVGTKLFVNGTQVGSTATDPFLAQDVTITIGGAVAPFTGSEINGWINAVRFTRAVRDVSTIPTVPFPTS